jgi:hypothetical protein
VLLIPALLIVMVYVRRHYHNVFLETHCATPLDVTNIVAPLVILPVQNWNQIVKKSLRFALKISSEIRVVHVNTGEKTEILREEWKRFVEEPAQQVGVAIPELIVLPSPYRLILSPIVDYVLDVERTCPDQQIAVLVPELVEKHWYHYLLHNKRASILKALLLLRGNRRIVLINVPWYLES